MRFKVYNSRFQVNNFLSLAFFWPNIFFFWDSIFPRKFLGVPRKILGNFHSPIGSLVAQMADNGKWQRAKVDRDSATNSCENDDVTSLDQRDS